MLRKILHVKMLTYTCVDSIKTGSMWRHGRWGPGHTAGVLTQHASDSDVAVECVCALRFQSGQQLQCSHALAFKLAHCLSRISSPNSHSDPGEVKLAWDQLWGDTIKLIYFRCIWGSVMSDAKLLHTLWQQVGYWMDICIHHKMTMRLQEYPDNATVHVQKTCYHHGIY